jgi:hypothetical protein
MKAKYVSVWDSGDVVCESPCDYNPDTKVCTNIETAENADDAENADMLTDEFVVLPNGDELREGDGVTFDY